MALMTAYIDPPGKILGVASEKNGIELWDAATGEQLRATGPSAFSVSISPDGKFIAASHRAGITLYDFPDLTAVRDIETSLDQALPATTLAFSAAGRTIAATNDFDDFVSVSGTKSGLLESSFRCDSRKYDLTKYHWEPVSCVMFSRDGSMLCAAGGTLNLWRIDRPD